MQGREKDAVIISLVRSNDKVRFHLGWTANTNVNYAIERGGLPPGEASIERRNDPR
jgi:hypothetical protein